MARPSVLAAVGAFAVHMISGFLVHAVLFKDVLARNAPDFYTTAVRADDDIAVQYIAAGSAAFAATQYALWCKLAGSFASPIESAIFGAVFGAGAYGHVALIEKGSLRLWDGGVGMVIDVAWAALAGAIGGYLLYVRRTAAKQA